MTEELLETAVLPKLARAASVAPLPAPARRYRPAVVRALFDQMAETYRWHGLLAGGLTAWWRQQLVARLPLRPGLVVIDLMTGTGELWPHLVPALGSTGRLRAVDFSGPMLAAANRRRAGLPGGSISMHQADACRSGLATGTADVVVCAFGLKTLAPNELPALAAEIHRLLKPGGTVALLELTVPAHGWRRRLCLGYLRQLNVLLRWIGGPLTPHTQLLGYARAFSGLETVAAACREAGLAQVRTERLTGGLASILLAWRPG